LNEAKKIFRALPNLSKDMHKRALLKKGGGYNKNLKRSKVKTSKNIIFIKESFPFH